MDSKLKELVKYSDPVAVAKKIKDKLDIPVYISTRKNKKYMVESPSGKMIHFGQLGYEDFTKHLDEDRRKAFLERNHKWKSAPTYTPRYLSYHFLW